MQLHLVKNVNIHPPFPPDCERAVFGMGCFWGAERSFWKLPFVYATAVGYCGGQLPNPSYHQVCTGNTNHIECVLIVFKNYDQNYHRLLGYFWTKHNPCQGMRQGNDIGTQYQSAIFTVNNIQKQTARKSIAIYQQALQEAGIRMPITTKIATLDHFYYAEQYHQQYLHVNRDGYCSMAGTKVAYPSIPLITTES